MRHKIAHVLYSGLGGHANVFFSMVDADKQKECDFAAIFFGIEKLKEDYIPKCNERNIPFHSVLKKPGFDIGAFVKVYRALKKEKPDIVFLHSATNILPATWYRVRSGFKAKVFVRETQPNHIKTFRDKVGSAVAFFFARRIIFLTEQFYVDQRKRMPLFFSKKKSRIIPNGIDLNLFKPAPPANAVKEQFSLGMQGRLYSTKDHSSLLQGFALLKEKPYFHSLQLLIAGDGDLRKPLEEEANKLGIADKVHFLGMLGEKQLPSFLQSLGIYIHASLGETMSTAIMQVMACRLPVIASDIFGINNMVVDGQNGLLVPTKNPEAIAIAIDRLYNDRELATTLAERGYEYAKEKFSNERMWNQYKYEFDNC